MKLSGTETHYYQILWEKVVGQNIFKRYELKYLLSIQQYQLLETIISSQMQKDKYGESNICNLYYDTDNYLLIRRSIEKPFYKEKLRIRSYGLSDSNSKVFVEIKKKYNSVVYKRRIAAGVNNAMDIASGKVLHPSQIGNEIAYFSQLYGKLSAKMFISYRRQAFFGTDSDLRVTFDKSILWRCDQLSLCGAIHGQLVLPQDKVLMEIKTSAAIPLWLVKVLSDNKIYKTSFSKYGTAYKLMSNQLGGYEVA